MTPNKVVSQFDPAIILSGSKAIKGDMKLKKSGSIYRVSYSGNSLKFWNKTHSKLIKKLKGNASGLDNEGALKKLKVEYTLKEKGGHLVLTSFSFYLRFAYAGYDISQEGTYTEINAIKVSTPKALRAKTATKKNHRVYHPKADDSFDIDIGSGNSNTQSSQSSESSSSSSQQSSSSQSSKSEEHNDEGQHSQSQSSTSTQSSDNKESSQQSQTNNSNNSSDTNHNNQGQAQNNQQSAGNQTST